MAVSDDAERRLGDRGRERRWGVSVDERCEGVVVLRVRAQRLYRAEVCAWRHWIGYGTDAGLRRMAAWTSRVCKTHTRSVASRPLGQPSDPSHEGLPERAIPRALLHSSSFGSVQLLSRISPAVVSCRLSGLRFEKPRSKPRMPVACAPWPWSSNGV